GERGGVSDEQEAIAREPSWPLPLHAVGVPPERRQREVVGQATAGAQRGPQALETPPDGHPSERADADVQEVALREIPAVPVEVGLREQLGTAVAWLERAQTRGVVAGLALLSDHDVLLVDDLAERARDRAVMTAGSPDPRRDA